MNCEKCGLENVEKLNYCPNCGNRISINQKQILVEIEETEIIETEKIEDEKPPLKEDFEPFPQSKDTPIKNKTFMFNATVILVLF